MKLTRLLRIVCLALSLSWLRFAIINSQWPGMGRAATSIFLYFGAFMITISLAIVASHRIHPTGRAEVFLDWRLTISIGLVGFVIAGLADSYPAFIYIPLILLALFAAKWTLMRRDGQF